MGRWADVPSLSELRAGQVALVPIPYQTRRRICATAERSTKHVVLCCGHKCDAVAWLLSPWERRLTPNSDHRGH